jgi:hypothetical protein
MKYLRSFNESLSKYERIKDMKDIKYITLLIF